MGMGEQVAVSHTFYFVLLATMRVVWLCLFGAALAGAGFLRDANKIRSGGLKLLDTLTKGKFDKFNRKTQNNDCHIVWEDHHKPHCTTEYEKICHDDTVEQCKTDYEKQCTTEYSQQCSTSYEDQCTTVQDKECWDEPTQECKTEYDEECWTEDKQECSLHPKCTTQYEQQCTTEHQTVCESAGRSRKSKHEPAATAADDE